MSLGLLEMAKAPTGLALPRVTGVLPIGFREAFTAPLPIQGYESQESEMYDGYWHYGEGMSPNKMHSDIAHFLPIIGYAMRASGLVLQPNTYLQARVRQGEAGDIGVSGLGWHSDLGEDDGVYKRVIVSDVLGTLYNREDPRPTPDFGMLLIDGLSQHSPQDAPEGVNRTRLQVTIFPHEQSNQLHPISSELKLDLA